MSSPDNSRIQKILTEIIDTERHYTDALGIMVKEFLQPLRDPSHNFGLKPESISAIFMNIESLLGFHTLFLAELTKSMHPRSLAQTILRFADFLRLYTTYVNGYTEAMKTLTELSHSKKFNAFQAEKREKLHLDLPSYLIMPVQRIPRYELLIKELIRTMEKQEGKDRKEEDEKLLEEALAKIVDIAKHVNDMKGKAERFSQLISLQTKMGGVEAHIPSLLSAHRRLIREGEVFKKTTFSHSSRYLYLFNDLFVWTEKGKYKGHFGSLDSTKVTDEEDSGEKDKEKSEWGFTIDHPTGKPQQFYVESSTDRQAWVSAFHEAIEESKQIPADDGFAAPNLHPHHIPRRLSVGSLNFKPEVEPTSPTHGPAEPQPLAAAGPHHPHQHLQPTLQLHHSSSSPSITVHQTPAHPSHPSAAPHGTATHTQAPQSTLSPPPAAASASNASPSTFNIPSIHADDEEDELDDDDKLEKERLDEESVEALKSEEKRMEKLAAQLEIHTAAIQKELFPEKGKGKEESDVPPPIPPRPQPQQTGLSTTHPQPTATTTASISSPTPPAAATIISHPSSVPSSAAPPIPSRPVVAASADHQKSTAEAIPAEKTKAPVDVHQRSHPKDNGTTPSVPSTTPSSALPRHPPSSSPPPELISRLTAAREHLSQLSRNDITALKKVKAPPHQVKMAIESVAVLLGLEPHQAGDRGFTKVYDYWTPVQSLLVKPTFLRDLLEFSDAGAPLSPEIIGALRKYVKDPVLRPSAVAAGSKAAGTLWNWVRAYYAKQTGEHVEHDDQDNGKDVAKESEKEKEVKESKETKESKEKPKMTRPPSRPTSATSKPPPLPPRKPAVEGKDKEKEKVVTKPPNAPPTPRTAAATTTVDESKTKQEKKAPSLPRQLSKGGQSTPSSSRPPSRPTSATPSEGAKTPKAAAKPKATATATAVSASEPKDHPSATSSTSTPSAPKLNAKGMAAMKAGVTKLTKPPSTTANPPHGTAADKTPSTSAPPSATSTPSSSRPTSAVAAKPKGHPKAAGAAAPKKASNGKDENKQEEKKVEKEKKEEKKEGKDAKKAEKKTTAPPAK